MAVCQAHAVLLRDVRELHRVLSAAGAGLSTVPQAALLLQVSKAAAAALLETRVERGAVVRTDPTGRSWTSPRQHTPPEQAVRRQPPAPVDEQGRSPDAAAELLAAPDTDPVQHELRVVEDDPVDTDTLGEQIRDDDGWGLALDDPYRWTARPPRRDGRQSARPPRPPLWSTSPCRP